LFEGVKGGGGGGCMCACLESGVRHWRGRAEWYAYVYMYISRDL
jgi:hypothetical protein